MQKKYKIRLNKTELKMINTILESESPTIKKKAKDKARVILLKSQGENINTIKKKTKLSKRTIINYCEQYINAKPKGMFFHSYKYNKSELNKFSEQIKNEFDLRPPLSYKDATIRIEKITGLKRSETQVRNYLNKNHIYTIHTRAKLSYQTKRKIKSKTNKYKEELMQQKS